MPLISSLERRRCQDRSMDKEKCTGNLLTISSLTQSSPSNRFQWWERGTSSWIKLFWVVLIRLRGCRFINIGTTWLEWVMSQGLYHFLERVRCRRTINFNRIMLAWRPQEGNKGSPHQLIMIIEKQQQLISLLRKTSKLSLLKKSPLTLQLILLALSKRSSSKRVKSKELQSMPTQWWTNTSKEHSLHLKI